MAVPTVLMNELEDMPRQLERALRLIPANRHSWRPHSWGGCPSEMFSAIEQVCHLRDIERDGYHVRIHRMLTESEPSLLSVDSYALARDRDYEHASLDGALAAFRDARGVTIGQLRTLGTADLERTGHFAEYGRLTLLALIHYLRSHDQQHLAGMHWLAGKALLTLPRRRRTTGE